MINDLGLAQRKISLRRGLNGVEAAQSGVCDQSVALAGLASTLRLNS